MFQQSSCHISPKSAFLMFHNQQQHRTAQRTKQRQELQEQLRKLAIYFYSIRSAYRKDLAIQIALSHHCKVTKLLSKSELLQSPKKVAIEQYVCQLRVGIEPGLPAGLYLFMISPTLRFLFFQILRIIEYEEGLIQLNILILQNAIKEVQNLMNPLEQLQIDPDVQIMLVQFKMHQQSKSKILQELMNILKQICDFQHFYAKNMDKFANSVSKLIEGKDPLKDVFIVFERMLATKSEQSSELAMNLKDDMIPFLLDKLVTKQSQFSIKQRQFRSVKRQAQAKNIKMLMQKKLRMLKFNQSAYKKAHLTLKPRSRQPIFKKKESNQTLNPTVYKQSSMPDQNNKKQPNQMQPGHLQKQKRTKSQQRSDKSIFEAQSNLNKSIDSFNHTFNKYMEFYSEICTQFTNIQTERNNIVRDAMNKFMIYQMNVARSVQYAVARYVKGLQEGSKAKILIHDVGLSSFSNFKEDQIPSNIIKLVKVQPENYKLAINDSIGLSLNIKDQINPITSVRNQTSKQQLLLFLKKFKVPQQITRKQYHQIIMQSFSMLNSCSIYGDVTFLKELINQYSLGLYMRLGNHQAIQNPGNKDDQNIVSIPILDGLVSHQIFRQKGLWTEYSKRLIEQAKQQVKTDFKKSIHSGMKLIANDLKMLQLLGMNDSIEKIKSSLKNYSEKLRSEQKIGPKSNEDMPISSGSLRDSNNQKNQLDSNIRSKIEIQMEQRLKKQISSLF